MDLAFDKRRQARGDGLIILRRFNDRLGPEGASRPGQKNQNKQRGKSGTVHVGTHCSDNLSTMSLFLPFFRHRSVIHITRIVQSEESAGIANQGYLPS